ncbi:Elongation of very long chain fatty acids protein 6 [Orchesella cincta]|uniref:Elongation of very long chain fatty acids protein n=1 Tax=Orchesella cincta TaxID=48709 RepID=A0A1D2MWC8_ORCCI|nr:Elongation of very long chain fatty acids protein 6 [Orchesella cincta]
MAEYYVPIRNQSYLDMYTFEEMDLPFWRQWFADNWIWSLYIGAVYVITIFSCQRFMKNREAFDLRTALALWNFGMAIFSIFAFSRVFPEIFYLLTKPNGLHAAACKIEDHGMSMAFWALTYTLSKALQLGDTLFIVLRKKKLILLHWYHHASVMILSWYAYQTYIPLLRFVGTMNYFVHGFMYTYYGLRACEIKVPKRVSIFVTILELMQMIAGFSVTLFCLWQYNYGDNGCLISARAITPSAAIYSTLFVLFAKHFRSTAFKQRGKLKSS